MRPCRSTAVEVEFTSHSSEFLRTRACTTIACFKATHLRRTTACTAHVERPLTLPGTLSSSRRVLLRGCVKNNNSMPYTLVILVASSSTNLPAFQPPPQTVNRWDPSLSHTGCSSFYSRTRKSEQLRTLSSHSPAMVPARSFLSYRSSLELKISLESALISRLFA